MPAGRSARTGDDRGGAAGAMTRAASSVHVGQDPRLSQDLPRGPVRPAFINARLQGRRQTKWPEPGGAGGEAGPLRRTSVENAKPVPVRKGAATESHLGGNGDR